MVPALIRPVAISQVMETARATKRQNEIAFRAEQHCSGKILPKTSRGFRAIADLGGLLGDQYFIVVGIYREQEETSAPWIAAYDRTRHSKERAFGNEDTLEGLAAC